VIAEIASPEVDQQLRQAQAELQQAQQTLELQQTARELARTTKARYQAADSEHAVARELVDQSVAGERTAAANVAAAAANVASNGANVRRVQALAAFERVTAPFDGTVVRRNVDQGALITAGSPQSTAGDQLSGLFEIAQLDTLRVFVSVPQVNAPDVKTGMPVSIDVRGRAAQLKGTVTRTANALDPITRTLLTEIDIPNAQHALLPGMFVYVGLHVASSEARWHVPATAVIADDRGTRVLTVGPDNKLHYQTVVLGRDYGGSVDIQSGLQGGEQILTQPRVSMLEGQAVHPRRVAQPEH
jgi:RND family efflux transporter MFP subunit